MEDLSLVELRVSYINELNLDDKKSLEDLINKFETNINEIVKHAKEVKIWEDQIIKLVFTDKYVEDVEKQALEWNLKVNLSNGRETKSVSKILSNEYYKKDETIIFFSLEIVKLEDIFQKILYQQLLRVHVGKLLENQKLAPHENQIKNPRALIDYAFFYLSIWLPELFANKFMKILFEDDKSVLNENNLFNEFCRKLKRDLFEYNSDEVDNEFRLNRFWYKTSNNFKNLIYAYIEVYIKNGRLNIKDDTFREIIVGILESILAIKEELERSKTYDINELLNKIIIFYEAFGIYLKELETNIHITFIKNPKEYFLDTLVDTEPRFVCFLDILGFTEMINDYENDLSSTILQDIQEALQESLAIFEQSTDENSKAMLSHLKYQLFSDCISISLPYFDNQEDFLNNFNLISTFTNAFQYNLMSKGFFVRGGISIGSFYSNNHIIFSKGLVEAYQLESKKAKYPRVLIDDKIIDKLLKYDFSKIYYHGINTYLVKDDDNLVFLNPFKIVPGLESQFERIKEDAKIVDDDQEFANAINTIYDLTFSLLDDQINQIKNTEQNQRDIIHEHILLNIERFFNEKKEKEFSKFVWIEQLLKWTENEESSSIKFENVFN